MESKWPDRIHPSLAPACNGGLTLWDTEYENDLHKIKHFTVRRGSGRLNHVRIYSLEGRYLGFLPQILFNPETSRFWGEFTPLHFTDDFPFYGVRVWEGGNWCCEYDYYSKDPFLEHRFSMTGGESSQWSKTEAGEWVFYAADYTFNYWALSGSFQLTGASSPVPSVAMQPGPNGPEVSARLMKEPKPDHKVLSNIATNIGPLSDDEADNADWQVGRLTGAMLYLIYSGNSDSAFQLLEMVWPKDYQLDYVDGIDRAYFKRRLEESVRASRYYQPWMLNDR